MIDINELRRLAQAALIGPDGFSMRWLKLLKDFQEEANPATITELLDRLEAAEADALEQARLNGMGASREAALMAKLEAAEKERTIDEQRIADLMSELNRVGQENEELRARIEAAEKERDGLHAKIEAMEQQEPTIWVNSSNIISAKINKERRGAGDQHTCSETKTAYHDAPHYALPGAKGE